MSAKIFSLAMGEISDKYINEAISYTAKKKQKRSWTKWIAAAACICLVLAGIFPLFNQPGVSPFVLTAYALESDGTLTPHTMQENVSVPLGKIELEAGFNGFLFSCPLDDPEELSAVTFLSAQTSPELPADALYGIMEEKGLQYFYYIPAENEGTPINFNVNINKENGDYFRYEIIIDSDGSSFTATLENQTVKYADEN